MKYQKAKDLAEMFATMLTLACSRVEIVGGVKRGDREECHDIELLIIPDPHTPRPEFGQKVIHKTTLDKFLFDLCEQSILKFKKGGDKYKQYEILEAGEPEPFYLELWIVNERTWGIQNVIRTGPRGFSHRFVTPEAMGGLLPNDHRYIKGETRIEVDGKTLKLPEEADALAVLGLGWIEPKDRHRYAGSYPKGERL
jgi:hypothetical protein